MELTHSRLLMLQMFAEILKKLIPSTGYETDPSDSDNCIDIDECAADTHNCASEATCTDTEGSFNCVCKEGFMGDGIQCTGKCTEIISRFIIHNCKAVKKQLNMVVYKNGVYFK